MGALPNIFNTPILRPRQLLRGRVVPRCGPAAQGQSVGRVGRRRLAALSCAALLAAAGQVVVDAPASAQSDPAVVVTWREDTGSPGNIRAISGVGPQNPVLRWLKERPQFGAFPPSPSLLPDGGLLLHTTSAHGFAATAVNAADGTVRWTRPVANVGNRCKAVSDARGRIWLTERDSAGGGVNIFAVDPQSGQELPGTRFVEDRPFGALRT